MQRPGVSILEEEKAEPERRGAGVSTRSREKPGAEGLGADEPCEEFGGGGSSWHRQGLMQ